MSIGDKLNSAKKALTVLSEMITFDSKIKAMIHYVSTTLFDKIKTSTLSEKQQTDEIDIATVGVMVLALSHYQHNNVISTLWNQSAYYAKGYPEVISIAGISDSFEADSHTVVTLHNERLVLAVGTKVMNGALPFEAESLCRLFETLAKEHKQQYLPNSMFLGTDLTKSANEDTLSENFSSKLRALQDQVHEIGAKASRRTSDYYVSSLLIETHENYTELYRIEAIFNLALNQASEAKDTAEKKTFIKGVEALKQATLSHFKAGWANYDFESAKNLASITRVLAEKVGLNQVTQQDVDHFKRDTDKYKDSHWIATAMHMILGALAGLVIGCVFGGVAGGFPGFLIGAATGAAAGASLAGLGFTMWRNNNKEELLKDPVNKVSFAATDFLPTSKNTM